jgi:hypothetical protein
MPSIFDPVAETALHERVARLTPDTPARWGRMHSAQMLCHLLDTFRVPLGESSTGAKSAPFRFFPLRWLFVYALPCGRRPHCQWSVHPAFGPLPTWEWGRMVYLHVDHHLRQFGV